MATAKKGTTAAKPAAKGSSSTKENALVTKKDAALTVDLQEGHLSSSALAAFGKYDAKNFEGVELDVTGNKELFKNDIIVPKLWLMQGSSELRKQKKAEDGDYVDSRSEEILLKYENQGEYLPIIPIKTFKRWQTFEIPANPKEKEIFVSSEVMVLGKNENYEYEFSEEGKNFRRRQVISAYVLLGQDVQKGIVKPYIVDFYGRSKGAGRDLISDIKVLNARELPSYVAWFKLSAAEDKKDTDSFMIRKVKFGGPLPEEAMPFLREAYRDITSMIDAGIIEIDDRDVREDAKTAASQAETNVVDKASDNAKI